MKTCGSTTASLTYNSAQTNEAGLEHLPTAQTWITTRSHDCPDGHHQATDQSETGTPTNLLPSYSRGLS